MYNPNTIRAFAVAAITLSAIGLLISVLLALKGHALLYIGVLSWGLLLWASWIGFKLSSYKLYPEEYKKVAIRIYLIIGAFFLFFFVGLMIGFVLSVILLATLWGLKRNYDDWAEQNVVESILPDEGNNEEAKNK
jgi:hypothetical protein